MTITLRRAMPALALVAGIALANGAAIHAATAAAAGPLSPAVAHETAAIRPVNHQIPGLEGAISCLTAYWCVAVGRGTHHGQIVVLAKGRQAGVYYIPSGQLSSVSCPTRSRCWAFGAARGGMIFFQIGSAGTSKRIRVLSRITAKLPAAVSMDQISCVSMTSCELDGQDTSTHKACAVRVVGTPAGGDNPQQAFSSCAELQAFVH